MIRQYLFAVISFLTLFASCRNTAKSNVPYSLKDTVLKEYIQTLDSLNHYDNTDINYKILKAYKDNDTSVFKYLQNYIDGERGSNHYWGFIDSCLHLSRLQDLNADEAYRFIYTVAFCPYEHNITISKKGDSANIHFITYQYGWDTHTFKVIDEFDKKITTKEWDDFSQAMADADFWGLKSDNGVDGVDGTTLTVTGFIKANPRFNSPSKFSYVDRWCNTTLLDPFGLILKLSKSKTGCF